MSETEYTPGPWRSGTVYGAIVADYKTSSYEESGHGDVNYYGGHLVCESVEFEANARLIAAAPEMLEALKEIVSDSGQGNSHDSLLQEIVDIHSIARDAIAKATGTAS